MTLALFKYSVCPFVVLDFFSAKNKSLLKTLEKGHTNVPSLLKCLWRDKPEYRILMVPNLMRLIKHMLCLQTGVGFNVILSSVVAEECHTVVS